MAPELTCTFVIVERIMVYDDVNPNYEFKYHYFDIDGEESIEIDFKFDVTKIQDEDYNFEFRDGDNKLLYSTELNDNPEDFIGDLDIEKIEPSKLEEELTELSYQYLILNKPYHIDKTLCINLYDVVIYYDLYVDDYHAHQSKIISLKVSYSNHDWLPIAKKYNMGAVAKIGADNIPEYIRNKADAIKTHFIAVNDFSALWLYRYYTGDIFIVNIEQCGNVKKKHYQYYLAVHLHIKNNKCGHCHDDCIVHWDDNEFSNLERFLVDNFEDLELKWHLKSCVIKYKDDVFVRQDDDCCFINKKIIDTYFND
jgi:hypothetical protein